MLAMFEDYDALDPENVLKGIERTGRFDNIESDLVRFMIARVVSVRLFDGGLSVSKDGFRNPGVYILTEAKLDAAVEHIQEQLAKYGE